MTPERVGRVARIDATGCACLTAAGPVRAEVAPWLAPVAGDWALLSGDRLVAVLPRAGAVRHSTDHCDVTGKVIAANAELALIVQPLTLFDVVNLTHRWLALASAAAATPVLVLSQADRASGPDEVADALAGLAVHAQPLGASPGVAVLAVSAVDGRGLDELRALIGDRTAVLVGPPHGGKSALLDALSGTRAVPSSTGSILVPLPGGGALIDTLPGDREQADGWLADRYATRLRCEQRARWRTAGNA
jgi:ribosome biogenesis GTPase